MAEIEVIIMVRVDGHEFEFKGEAVRSPLGEIRDTYNAVNMAVHRAIEGKHYGGSVSTREALELKQRGLASTMKRYSGIKEDY